ncbi:hypothetical protein MHPYR_180002 [uncultured Mycobacterium sp.]|uniref:Uncharacterized protein n=1 Tax=uncultured Mycobacterium sp. TaxID=171292 RepID=A0A1Y5P4V4_9MYCO|nr:hypothetical protein MHPYR_180002 [uncultured Mycobacterium sp.]
MTTDHSSEPFVDSSPHFPILDSDRTEANDELNRLGLLHDQVTVSVTRPDWPVWS